MSEPTVQQKKSAQLSGTDLLAHLFYEDDVWNFKDKSNELTTFLIHQPPTKVKVADLDPAGKFKTTSHEISAEEYQKALLLKIAFGRQNPEDKDSPPMLAKLSTRTKSAIMAELYTFTVDPKTSQIKDVTPEEQAKAAKKLEDAYNIVAGEIMARPTPEEIYNKTQGAPSPTNNHSSNKHSEISDAIAMLAQLRKDMTTNAKVADNGYNLHPDIKAAISAAKVAIPGIIPHQGHIIAQAQTSFPSGSLGTNKASLS